MLRKGDKVGMTGTVQFSPDDDEEMVFVHINGTTVHVKQRDLTLVEPVFKVGDSVSFEGGYSGTILSISGLHAWVDLENGNYATRTLTSMTREPPPKADVTPDVPIQEETI